MSKPGYAFKKLIFLGLEEKQIELVKRLKGELGDENDSRYWVFMKNDNELHYHLDPKSVIICPENQIASISTLLLKFGHPFLISWKFFLKNFYNLVHLESLLPDKKVCLAFLPPNYSRLYETLFRFYGIHASIIESVNELEKKLNEGIDYLVFDLDMSQAGEKEKFKMMQTIRYFTRQGLNASVIKNFDKGSLFNDLMSPVKEISNILLSPEEYLLFLRKYLLIKGLETLNLENSKQIGFMFRYTFEDKISKRTRVKANWFVDLKDSKKIYNKIQSMGNEILCKDFLQEQNLLYLKFILSEGIAESLQKESESNQRELFTFFTH